MKSKNLKFLFSAIFCFAFLQLVEAQGWWKTYDHQGGKAETLLSTPDGGYFLHSNFHFKTDAVGNQQSSGYVGSASYGNRTAVLLDSGGYALIYFSPFNPGYLERVRRLDEFGNFIWSAEIPLVNFNPIEAQTASIDQTNDGDLIAGFGYYDYYSCECRYYTLHKFDIDGNVIWSVAQTNNDDHYTLISLKSLSDGGIALAGHKDLGNDTYAFVEKRDSAGNILWEKSWPGISHFSSIIEATDSTLVATGVTSDSISLVKISQNGDEIWSQSLGFDTEFLKLVVDDLKEVPSGGFVMAGSIEETGVPNHDNGLIFRTDANGNELWHRIFNTDNYQERFKSIQALPNGEFAVCGEQNLGPWWPPSAPASSLLLKTDSLGYVYTHQIFGNVFNDEALDCTFDSTEMGLLGWVVTAVGEEIFYGNTDENGDYSILVDTGDYELSISTTGLWESCEVSYPVTAANVYDSTAVNIPLQPEYICPMMEVDISAPFIRPCSLGYYSVQYCNLGTEIAIDATVEVELADGLTYDGTTNGNLLSQDGQTLIFGLGNVNINECNTFSFTFMADCDTILIGETLCTEAHIFPDTNCLENLPIPDIELDGVCENDSVKFEILNIGEDMPGVFEYIIIEDNIILLQGDFQLNENQSDIIIEEAMPGSTYHMIAAQDVNYPSYLGNPVATFTLEGCVGTTDPGAYNQIPQDDGEPWLSIACDEVTSSYDPNDKTPPRLAGQMNTSSKTEPTLNTASVFRIQAQIPHSMW